MTDKLKATTDATFAEDVLQAETPVLVDFWAPWCAQCRTMMPYLETLAEESGMAIVKLDVQDNAATANEWDVMTVPALLLFVGGELKERLPGFIPVGKIMERVAGYLGGEDAKLV